MEQLIATAEADHESELAKLSVAEVRSSSCFTLCCLHLMKGALSPDMFLLYLEYLRYQFQKESIVLYDINCLLLFFRLFLIVICYYEGERRTFASSTPVTSVG